MKYLLLHVLLLAATVAVHGQTIYDVDPDTERLFLMDHFVDTAMDYIIVNEREIVVAPGGITETSGDWKDLFLAQYTVSSPFFSIPKDRIVLNQHGFFEIGQLQSVDDRRRGFPLRWYNDRPEEKVVIPGMDIFLIEGLNLNTRFASIQEAEAYESMDPFDVSPIEEHLNIADIDTGSFLTENIRGTEVRYAAENLYRRFFSNKRLSLFMVNAVPWAARNEHGESDTIDVSFVSPSRSLNVLNGFVDPNRQHLYRANDRLKSIEITPTDGGADFVLSVEFHDVVYFNNITLPRATESIRISVSEVYEGTRYSDIVVTAIVGENTYSKVVDE